jgi:hypothetical protein
MTDTFNLYDVYEHNLNFLFGAGASFGFLPTLELKVKDDCGKVFTIESLAHRLEEDNKEELRTLLFMFYYRECILPGLPILSDTPFSSDRKSVLNEYESFLDTLVKVLEHQKGTKKANVYTTNYDSCLELSSDSLLSVFSGRFVVNDGSSGFQNKRFHTRNYNNRVVQKGIFDKHEEPVPQINILHPHGSVYWVKDDSEIGVRYHEAEYEISFTNEQNILIDNFKKIVSCEHNLYGHVLALKGHGDWSALDSDRFWQTYKKIPIVNPTKWKFHETVFEEAYYQILRHLSFELERPNSILLTFGFSFADEHIFNLVQRSLSNPTLTVYVCCFNEEETEQMKGKFLGYDNVKFISTKNNLTFSEFNQSVFTLKKDGE